MAIISVEELASRSGSWDKDNKREYERIFGVECDTKDETAAAVLLAMADEAAVNDAIPGDAFAFATNIEATQTDDQKRWEVSVSYGTPDLEKLNEEGQPEANPFFRRPTLSWSFQTVNVPVNYDSQNEAIVNSSGDPPATAIERTEYLPILKITRNEMPIAGLFPSPAFYFDSARYMNYAGKVNADTFRNAEPGTVIFIPGGATEEFDQTYGIVWKVEYQFLMNPLKHSPIKILDQGFRVLNDNDEPVYVVDDEGERVEEAVLLDGSGKKLDSGSSPVFLEYDHIPQLPFSVFQLGA